MKDRKFKNFFSRDRKNLYMILSIILVSIFTLSIAYAVLSTTLNITGSAEISSASWDIYLDNVEVKSGSVEANVPEITGNDSLSFEANLATLGDFYEFTVDVVNDGSIDAMIDSVVKTPELTTDQAKYIKYEITYQNGESINEKQTLKKETTTPIKVRIEYRKDLSASDLPSTTTELSLGLTLVYVQSDGSGSEIPNNGAKLVNVVSGDGTQVGDEVCIGEECFYVISSTESTVTMLAKYNLYVGKTYDNDSNSFITYGEEATGRQDSTMLGYVDGQSISNGITVFSHNSAMYSGSVVEGYVNNYGTYLLTQGLTPIEARLIMYEELIGLGCVWDEEQSVKTCSSAPSWVYATSYWVNTDRNEVWKVLSNAYFNNDMYNNSNTHGVRPVITISRSLL